MRVALRSGVRADAVIEEVRARVPQPVEPLEIAAVLESIGITDAVAAEDYGAASSFELAERIFDDVRERAGDVHRVSRRARSLRRLNLDLMSPGRFDRSARNLVSLMPLAMLVVATQALGASGWSSRSILALSFGVTAAMLLTMGPMVAIGRRASILLSFGYRASAHRFVTLSSFGTLLGCVVAGSIAVEIASRYWPIDELRSTFALSLVAFALLWLLAMGLVILRAPAPVAVALGAGLGVGLAAGSQFSGSAGVAIGYGTAVLLLAVFWALVHPREIERRVRLPAAIGLAEAIPYVTVGTAMALLLVLPHPLGWYGGGKGTTFDQLLTFEQSLLLALLPLLVATCYGDRILRSFWGFAEVIRDENSVDGFRHKATAYVFRGLANYVFVLFGLSILTGLGVEFAMREGRLDDASRLVFWCGLGAFLLLGVGQYCCTFMLGLSLPRHALAPLLVGLTVLGVLGLPLAERNFELAAVAFVAATGAFAGTATIACLDVLREVPRRYATAF